MSYIFEMVLKDYIRLAHGTKESDPTSIWNFDLKHETLIKKSVIQKYSYLTIYEGIERTPYIF